ncbi:MAG: DUF6174 domain-containing protein [Candidatus Eisenbacteria bacterium]|nr:DUF6174 domain-containing protein [Candidatus Eisenbacteria bacterium]
MNLVSAISRHSWIVTATLLLVLPLISCSDDDGDVDDRLRELRRNRALWRLHAIDDYRFVQHKSCFCGGGYADPMRVEVREGSIVRVERVSDARPLPASLALTVENAFERIEQAIDREYEFLKPSSIPGWGFPRSSR